MNDMGLDQALQTFFMESRELLVSMEESLLGLESAPDDADAISAIFRAAHTIKGSGGMFGLEGIVAFTHVVENVLDRVRNGAVAVNGDLIALLLSCRDYIGTLVEQIAVDPASKPDKDTETTGTMLLDQLKAYQAEQKEQYPAPTKTCPPSLLKVAIQGHCDGDRVENDDWHISLRFGHDVLRNGMEPLAFIRYLGNMGEISHIAVLPDAIPYAPDMDPESCYLGFEIDFHGADVDKAAIEMVFEFVCDDCSLRILPPHSRIDEYVQLINELPEDKIRLGELLVNSGSLTPKELDNALRLQAQRAESCLDTAPDEVEAISQLGGILVEQGMVQPEVVGAALGKQKLAKENKVQESKLIRIQADKLDQLINLVGEIVITGSTVSLLAQRTSDTALHEATSTLSRLVEEIRDGALQLRMVQIGETFNRFHRVVRDVSKELGKDIELDIDGAETELDKSVVEKISDPLMHLVRNSMDHGIEKTEVRLQRGKPAKGSVHLNAYHESGSIVIEVGDDGGGLNRERILSKAIEKGLVAANQTLSDQEVYGLIFEAGFSTAEAVTNLSGRGVGMDVVRRNIEALRGTVEIDSREGIGTTVKIRLPLTLAIIDGFLMGVGSAAYVVPLDMVMECLELGEKERQETCNNNYINLRGSVVPFIRLCDHFHEQGKASRYEKVVVVQYAGQQAGLVVDELMGEFQAVIKPLGKLFGNLKGVSGSTILGSGEVALVLEVPALIQRAVNLDTRSMNQSAIG
jgi:two-component system chemotaxis sensor kinase CheA